MQRESGRRGSQRRPRAPAALDLARARSHNRADRCSDPTTPQLGNSAAARPARSIAAAIASAAFADALAPVSHVGLIDAAALARLSHASRLCGRSGTNTHARSRSVMAAVRLSLTHTHALDRSSGERQTHPDRGRWEVSLALPPACPALSLSPPRCSHSLAHSSAQQRGRRRGFPPRAEALSEAPITLASGTSSLRGIHHPRAGAPQLQEARVSHTHCSTSSSPRPLTAPRHRHDDDHPSERQTHRVAARSQADGSRLERSVRSSRRGLRCVDSRAQHTHTQREPRVSEQAATLAHTARERGRRAAGEGAMAGSSEPASLDRPTAAVSRSRIERLIERSSL